MSDRGLGPKIVVTPNPVTRGNITTKVCCNKTKSHKSRHFPNTLVAAPLQREEELCCGPQVPAEGTLGLLIGGLFEHSAGFP